MNCQQATKYIWDYCDNILSPSLGLRLEKHCEDCEECRRNLRLTRLENEVLSDSSALPPLSSGFTARVMSNLPAIDRKYDKNHKKMGLIWLRRGHLRTASTAILATLLLLVVVPLLANKSLVPWDSVQPVPNNNSQLAGIAKNEAPQDQVIQSLTTENTVEKLSMTDNDTSISEAPSPEVEQNGEQPSPPVRVSTATETSRGKGPFPYTVHLPAVYKLVNSSVASSNAVVYRYAQSDSENVFQVTVTCLETVEEMPLTNDSTPAQFSTGANGSETAKSQPTLKSVSRDTALPTPSNSVVSWIVHPDDKFYRITLDGNLSPQELALLAGSIEFRK